MRIYGPNGMAGATAAPAARRSPGNGFTLGNAEQAKTANPSTAAHSIGGLDALIALQGVEDATERRRRAVKKGRSALDALEAVKLGFLSGRLDAAALARLTASATDLAQKSGDPGLDSVLAEIELRVGVELAKIGASDRA